MALSYLTMIDSINKIYFNSNPCLSLRQLLVTDGREHQLKKVINRVAAELKELGLTSEVLKDLLEGDREVADERSSPDWAEEWQDHVLDDVELEEKLAGIARGVSESSANVAHGKRRASKSRRPHASYEMAGKSVRYCPRYEDSHMSSARESSVAH
jgi:hypothetical protein